MTRVLCALACVLSLSAFAPPEDVANDVSRQVMSPYCPGVTLHDCPSEEAVDLRARIVSLAEQGFTRAQIMTELEREFGPTIRAVPPARGTGLLAWLLPALAALGGAAIGWVLLRKWIAGPPPDAADPEGDELVGPRDRERLEAELAALRSAR